MPRPDVDLPSLRAKAQTGTCRLYAPQVLELLAVIDTLCGALHVAGATSTDENVRKQCHALVQKYGCM